MPSFREERDSLGKVRVPKNALWGAQTQRAVQNFPISALTFSRPFIKALGLIKLVAAQVNTDLKLLDAQRSRLIQRAAKEVIAGKWDDQFPVDIFQTGSGTSTNMNANEVIARRAEQLGKGKVDIHPNDHVNRGQSSNDVIPTAICLSALMACYDQLTPALETLRAAFAEKGVEYADVVMTGRTHLMDAMPLSFAQRFGAYASQLLSARLRLEASYGFLRSLPQGGTAVGSGINTHRQFGKRFAKLMAKETGIDLLEAGDHFEAQASLGPFVGLHGQLKALATDLMKMANDLRWMNSGPNAGLAEVQLKALQPGSSIMPGKVNPVMEEAMAMVAMRVMGNDTTVTLAAQSGNFELNVALPVTAHCLLESIHLLSNGMTAWAEKSVRQLKVSRKRVEEQLQRNPILATALNPVLGYEKVAEIVKKAQKEGRSLIDVATEQCPELSEKELRRLLDARKMI